MPVSDTDHGYKELIAKLAEAEAEVTVGIHSDADGNVLQYATYNEFGLGVPERSFLRAWADGNRAEAMAILHGQLRAWVRTKSTTEITVPLQRAGLKFAAEIKARIVGGISPENEPATLAQKAGTTPLIDSNALLGSIVSKVK